MDIFSLEGRVAVVTGASGLLGQHHCFALAEAGAHVVAADLDLDGARYVAGSLPTKSVGLAIDVTEPESVRALLTEILDGFGRVDVLVNNAAIDDKFVSPQLATEQSMFENYPLEMWEKMMRVNVTGTFLCAQVIGQSMVRRAHGSIINIASTYGVVGPDQSIYLDENNRATFYKSPAYPTSKGAVISFTRYLAAYWGQTGVRVNALTPGGVENTQTPAFIKRYSQRTPMNRMAQATDLKGAIVFLASDASSYMTGANLIVDGGWTAW